MKCLKPFFHYPKGYDTSVPLAFPCGHCEACRAAQSSVWTLRMQLESVSHDTMAFVTLTYDDEKLGYPAYSLEPSHTQAWLKRFRLALDYPIRFYLCGEYGDKTKRPHYHAVIFGLKPKDYELVKKTWGYGNVKVETGRVESLAYVAGYVTKKLGVLKKNPFYNDRTPEFHRCSKGLGLKAFLAIGQYTPFLEVNGYKKYVGRYLRNKSAEAYGILDDVKKKGIMQLEALTQDLICNTKKFLDTALFPSLACATLSKRTNYRVYYKTLYQYNFKGIIEEYLSRIKLKNLKKQRKDL